MRFPAGVFMRVRIGALGPAPSASGRCSAPHRWWFWCCFYPFRLINTLVAAGVWRALHLLPAGPKAEVMYPLRVVLHVQGEVMERGAEVPPSLNASPREV